MAEVLAAAWEYADRTHRRVSIEYALIRDINDQQWRADALARLLRGNLVHVNLIPPESDPRIEVDGLGAEGAGGVRAPARAGGIAVTVRDTRGREIDGACGQLAAAD